MSAGYTPGLTITEQTTIKRRRELSLLGEVKVKVGDIVKANDIVARAELPGELHILRIGDELGLTPEEVHAGFLVGDGEYVHQGTTLCMHKGLFGLFKSTYVAPEEGKVEMLSQSTGNLGIRKAPKELSLDAYVSGKVVEVVEGKAVVIESHAGLVQGIFGVGGERYGEILVLPEKAELVIEVSDIPADVRGKVLVAAGRPTADALNRAREQGATGFVVGSIDDRDLTVFVGYEIGLALTGDEPTSMTLIITEGFGDMRMSARAFEVLKRFQGKLASINGVTQVRAGAMRPEVLVCYEKMVTPGTQVTAAEVDHGFVVGRKVRAIRVPYFGWMGKVMKVPKELVELETGAMARVVTIIFENEVVERTLPRANIEML